MLLVQNDVGMGDALAGEIGEADATGRDVLD
jgi:hypothetical protein